MNKALSSRKIFLLFFAVLSVSAFTQPQVIAHRGYWKVEGSAQNSIASLMKADSIKVFGSEVDIWLLLDGIPIVNHDADVELNGNKLVVQNTPAAILQTIPLSNGEKLPTFEEYLDAFEKCNHVKLIIEFKTHRTNEQEEELVRKVMKMINDRDLKNKVEYISFGINFIHQVLKNDCTAKVYYLNGNLSPQEIAKMGAAGIDYHYNVFYKNPDWITSAHALGQKINVWTVNKPEDIQKMIDLHVDFITTDEPLLVLEILQNQP